MVQDTRGDGPGQGIYKVSGLADEREREEDGSDRDFLLRLEGGG